jgi:hypothetical protein
MCKLKILIISKLASFDIVNFGIGAMLPVKVLTEFQHKSSIFVNFILNKDLRNGPSYSML